MAEMPTQASEQASSAFCRILPVDGVLFELGDLLDNESLVALSSTCHALDSVYRPRILLRMKEFASNRPGFFYWSCFDRDTRNALDLMHNGMGDPNTALVCNRDTGWEEIRDTVDAAPSCGLGQWYHRHLPCSGHQDKHRGKFNHFIRVQWTEDESQSRNTNHYSLEQKFDRDPVDGLALCSCKLVFPLHLAAASGNLDLVKALVEQGAHLDVPCRYFLQDLRPFLNPRYYQTLNTEGFPEHYHFYTPLYIAIIAGHHALVEYLLSLQGATHRCWISDLPLSILHAAAASGDVDMVRLVLRHTDKTELSVLLNQPNFAGLTPLWVAVVNNHLDVMDLLQSLGAHIDHDLGTGFTPLIYSSMRGNLDALQRLVSADSDIYNVFKDLPDRLQDTMVGADCLTAPARSYTEEASVEPQTNVYFQRLYGLRPIEVLLRLKALDKRNRVRLRAECGEGCSPELCQCEENLYQDRHHCFELIALLGSLVKAGKLDVNARNPVSGLCLTTALFQRHDSFYKGGSNTQYAYYDKERIDNFLYHINSYRSDLLRALLELGADPTARDNHGNGLVELALAEWDLDCCRIVASRDPAAISSFSRHWTLSQFMLLFLVNPEKYGPLKHKSTVCREGLEMFLEFNLITREDLARRPLLPVLFRRSIQGRRNSWTGNLEHTLPWVFDFILSLPLSDKLLNGDLGGGKPILHHAAEVNDLSAVRKLVKKGCNIHLLDGKGYPLSAKITYNNRGWEFKPMMQSIMTFLADKGLRLHLPCPDLTDASEHGRDAFEGNEDALDKNGLLFEDNLVAFADFWCMAEGRYHQDPHDLSDFCKTINHTNNDRNCNIQPPTLTWRPQDPHLIRFSGMVVMIREATNIRPSVRHRHVVEVKSNGWNYQRDLESLQDLLVMYPLVAHADLPERFIDDPFHATRDEWNDYSEDRLEQIFERERLSYQLYDNFNNNNPPPFEKRPPLPENLATRALQARYLREACSAPNHHVLRVLLNRGAEVNSTMDDGLGALVWTIKSLAEDSHLSRHRFNTMLPWDRREIIVECMRTLLAHGADLRKKETVQLSVGVSKSLSFIDFIRGLVDWNTPELAALWGPRRYEIAVLLLNAGIQDGREALLKIQGLHVLVDRESEPVAILQHDECPWLIELDPDRFDYQSFAEPRRTPDGHDDIFSDY